VRPRLARALQVSAAELDALLSADEHLAAGRAPDGPRTRREDQDDMIRREFLRLLTTTGALVSLPSGSTPVPTAAAPGDAERATAHLWQVYAQAKAKQSVYPLVRDHLADLARDLSRPHPSARHRELCTQAADLYQLAGEIFFDANGYTEAAQCYTLAASAGEEAGDSDRWAAALTRHAFLGLHEGRFKETAPMLDAAALLAGRGDSQLSTRYWVAAVQAQVHAGSGDLDACNRAMDAAQQVQYLGTPCPGGWLRFDGSRLDEERGSCYVRLGRLDLAEAALNDALGRAVSPRRRGSVLTDLALIGARRRDIDRLLSYGAAAAELAERTSSGYVGRRLEELHPHLAPLLGDRRVGDLADRIASLNTA
jgi:tetratricopeptide (TPR) repeat protein